MTKNHKINKTRKNINKNFYSGYFIKIDKQLFSNTFLMSVAKNMEPNVIRFSIESPAAQLTASSGNHQLSS